MSEVVVIETNFDKVGAVFGNAALAVEPSIGQGLMEFEGVITDIVVPAIQEETPVLTGVLEESTQAQIIASGQDLEIDIIQDAQNTSGQYYAPYLLGGTVYMEANDYITRALDNVDQDISDALIFGTNRILTRVEGVMHL